MEMKECTTCKIATLISNNKNKRSSTELLIFPTLLKAALVAPAVARLGCCSSRAI